AVGIVPRVQREPIACVAATIAIPVRLVRVRKTRTIVGRAPPGDRVVVGESVVILIGTCVTRVPYAVVVEVELQRVRGRRAVVTDIPQAVSVQVRLRRIRYERTVVGKAGIVCGTRVTETILIRVDTR